MMEDSNNIFDRELEASFHGSPVLSKLPEAQNIATSLHDIMNNDVPTTPVTGDCIDEF